MSAEGQLRDELVRLSASLFQRGYSVGSAGNISARCDGGYLMTPTNSSLGSLEAEKISKLDENFEHVSGDKPSKEVFLHRAFYETRPQSGAVVHLHSTFATALSCLPEIDPHNTIAPLTPYVVMRVGDVPLVRYTRPGDPKSGELIRDLKGRYSAVLLANHGPVVSAPDLRSAVYAAEELEETAKLLVLIGGRPKRLLTIDQVNELTSVFAGMR